MVVPLSPPPPAGVRHLGEAVGQVWFLRVPCFQPGMVRGAGVVGECRGLRLSTAVPHDITTVPTGPEVSSSLFQKLLRPCCSQNWKSINAT